MPERIPSHRPRRLPGPGRHRDYDRHARDRDSARFYCSARWRTLRLSKLRQDPLCERCKAQGTLVPATIVHHKVERRDEPELELEWDNLESLCPSCHSRHHASDVMDATDTK